MCGHVLLPPTTVSRSFAKCLRFAFHQPNKRECLGEQLISKGTTPFSLLKCSVVDQLVGADYSRGSLVKCTLGIGAFFQMERRRGLAAEFPQQRRPR